MMSLAFFVFLYYKKTSRFQLLPCICSVTDAKQHAIYLLNILLLQSLTPTSFLSTDEEKKIQKYLILT